jgi:hypothetical protein
MLDLYERALEVMDQAFEILEDMMPPPTLILVNGNLQYRYTEQTIHQAIILKMARLINDLRAMLLLWKHGYFQDQAAIQRILDELKEDIQFLVDAETNDAFTDLHQRYLDEFYQEEFEEGKDPLESAQKRDRVARRKIRAHNSRVEGKMDGMNPSFARDVSNTLSKAYSGYIHAAAPHIMELYGGNPPSFHLSGMKETPKSKEHAQDIELYIYRGLMTVAIAAHAFGNQQIVDQLKDRVSEFESASGLSPS